MIKERHLNYQMRAEASPDKWLRYDYAKLLDESRAALAKHLNAPVDTVVLVPNATTAVNTVLRNIVWDADGKDEILTFSSIYGGCGKTVDYITDTNNLVSSRTVDIIYPIEDDEIIERFKKTVETSCAEGKRIKLVVFDIVTSQPGVRFPFEKMSAICRELGILSLIDGAQGVGMIPLNLTELDADFVTSNCHKWLFVPRGCAFLYVPIRNQELMVSSLPTSFGYIPKSNQARQGLYSKDNTKSAFVDNFQFHGTIDNSPYLCVKDALEWREKVLGGEERIVQYLWKLAKDGGERVAEILGTEVLENKTGTLTNQAMINVWLPIRTGRAEIASSGLEDIILPEAESPDAITWAVKVLVDEYKTFFPIAVHNGRWYARLSAQVYLDMNDFEWAGQTLKNLCEKLGQQVYKQ